MARSSPVLTIDNLQDEQSYGTTQVANLLEVSHRTVAKWCDKGLLTCYKKPGPKHSHRWILGIDLKRFIHVHGIRHVKGDEPLVDQVVRCLREMVAEADHRQYDESAVQRARTLLTKIDSTKTQKE